MVRLDFQEESDPRVLWDSLVSTESQVKREIPDSGAQAHPVSRETADCPAWKDRRDLKDPQEEMV